MLLALLAYVGYYALSDEHQRWAYYVATGALCSWLGWQYMRASGAGLGAFVGVYVCIEGGMQAACGAAAWAQRLGIARDDVCIAVGGGDFLAAVSALAVSALIVWGAKWLNPPQRR